MNESYESRMRNRNMKRQIECDLFELAKRARIVNETAQALVKSLNAVPSVGELSVEQCEVLIQRCKGVATQASLVACGLSQASFARFCRESIDEPAPTERNHELPLEFRDGENVEP
jgi:hypothetical protein